MDTAACAICGQNPAALFCLCQHNLTLLCQACISQHCQNVPSGLHDFCAIDNLELVNRLSLPVYKTKKLAIAQGLALMDTLQKQEQEDYTAAIAGFNNLFQQIRFLIDSLHGTLEQAFALVKQSIQGAIFEADHPEMIDFILKNGQVMQSLKVNLYSFPALIEIEKCRATIMSTIETFQTTDFAAYILTKMKNEFVGKAKVGFEVTERKVPFSPVLKTNILRKYFASEIGGMALIEYPFSTRVDQESAYALMENGELFCCGGTHSSKQSIIISTNSSKMTILPFMCHGHSCPGVISFNNMPHVFGGRDGNLSLNCCERFNAEEEWEMLPSMTRSRSSFSPVLFNSVIYLAGGLMTNAIEAYEPVKMTFRTLQVELPFQGKNVAFVYGDNLYVLAKSDLMVVDLRTESNTVRGASVKTSIETWSPAPPIVSEGKAYFWGFENGGISSFFRRTFVDTVHGIYYVYDIEKKTVKQIDRFEYSTTAA